MKIEDIITQNRHAFDAESIPENYLSNFEKRLQKPKRRLQFSIAISTMAAAVIALVFMLQMPATDTPLDDQSTIEAKEIAEMQAYYEGQQQRTITIIQRLLENVDPETQQSIRAELTTMEIENKEFKLRYRPDLPVDEYIAYEVNYYQARQQSLEYIKTILQK